MALLNLREDKTFWLQDQAGRASEVNPVIAGRVAVNLTAAQGKTP